MGTEIPQNLAAVSSSPSVYRLPATGIGFWFMGKVGCAWVGAWVGAWWWCLAVLGLGLRLDMGVGGCLDGDGEEEVGVVPTHYRL